MTCDDADATDWHRSKAVDNAVRHVCRDINRCAGGAEACTQEDDAWHDIVYVVAGRIKRTTEDIGEQQH
ncbi:hypothetical protein D3C85_1344800 [compost metagenome]